MDDTYTVHLLQRCARCGEDHDELTFKRMAIPMEYDAGRGDGVELSLTHWAMCPTSGDPILMRFA